MAAIQDLESMIERAVERVGRSVVGVGGGWRGGSGVVVGEELVLTVAHNLRGAVPTVTFSDGRRVAASIAGLDPDRDLAVLRADTGETPALEPSSGDEAANVGSAVVALASPGGRGLHATLGFVSAVDRSFRGPHGSRVTGCVEHTAPLPRGSSGSPLLAAGGHLIGLNAVRLEGGLIVALPAERARIESLARGERQQVARLGVAVAPPHIARRMRRAVGLPEEHGVLVRSVERCSAAERAGIEQGDLIVVAGERRADSLDALYEALADIEPGGELELEVARGAERRNVTISFGEQDAKEVRP